MRWKRSLVAAMHCVEWSNWQSAPWMLTCGGVGAAAAGDEGARARLWKAGRLRRKPPTWRVDTLPPAMCLPVSNTTLSTCSECECNCQCEWNCQGRVTGLYLRAALARQVAPPRAASAFPRK